MAVESPVGWAGFDPLWHFFFLSGF